MLDINDKVSLRDFYYLIDERNLFIIQAQKLHKLNLSKIETIGLDNKFY